MDTKQVIIIRKDLNMRKGKMISQGAHASLGAILSQAETLGKSIQIEIKDQNNNFTSLGNWLNGKFKKITVSVNSEAELLSLAQKAKEAGIIHALIQDSGLTEFGGVPTYTALAIGPDYQERIDHITGNLPLL